MFGVKKEKAREIEEKLRQADVLQAEYELAKHELRKTKGIAEEVFVTLEAGNAQLDKDLQQLSDIFRDGEKEGQVVTGTISDVGKRLGDLAETAISLEMEVKSCEDLDTSKEKEAVEGLAASQEQLLHSNKEQSEKAEKRENSLKELKDIHGHLKQSAKNMGVLALSAAIEAGRLGESGREFVQAAEDVRKLSEIYDQGMQEAEEKLSDIEEGFKEQKEWLIKLNDHLSETQHELKQLIKEESKELEEEIKPTAKELALADKIREQEGAVREAAAQLEDHLQLYENAISQISAVKDSYMESAKVRGELEGRLEKLYQKTKI